MSQPTIRELIPADLDYEDRQRYLDSVERYMEERREVEKAKYSVFVMPGWAVIHGVMPDGTLFTNLIPPPKPVVASDYYQHRVCEETPF